MSTEMATRGTSAATLETVLIQGNLAGLTPEQRVEYYLRVCDSVGLNPLTRPFEYLTFQGKLVLYARRDCTEQLRTRDGVSVKITGRDILEGVYVVTAQAVLPSQRVEESTGCVAIDGLKGEARANAMMKAETKAKRRVTLSICGLGMLDESEIAGEAPPVVTQLPAAKSDPYEAARKAYLAATTLQELGGVWGKLPKDVQAATVAEKDQRKAELSTAGTGTIPVTTTAPTPTEGEKRPDPIPATVSSAAAPAPSSSVPAPVPTPTSRPSTPTDDAPRIGGELVARIMAQLHEVDLDWSQIREDRLTADLKPGSGICGAIGLVPRANMRCGELTAAQGLKLDTLLRVRVAKKVERSEARRNGQKKQEVEA